MPAAWQAPAAQIAEAHRISFLQELRRVRDPEQFRGAPGVLVCQVIETSNPLQAGDIILHYRELPVGTVNQLLAAILADRSGQLLVLRGDEHLTIPALPALLAVKLEPQR
ncbi:MAG: hypothetical protein AAGC55_15420 [Myxococcota bacterium]